MCLRDCIDVFQGPYCAPGTGLCGPGTVLMCTWDYGCDSGLYRCPRDCVDVPQGVSKCPRDYRCVSGTVWIWPRSVSLCPRDRIDVFQELF